MKRLCALLATVLLLFWAAPGLGAADAAPAAAGAPEATGPAANAEAQKAATTAAAAAVAADPAKQAHTPGFLEHLVDIILEAFDVRSSGNTVTHYVIAMVLLVAAFALRRLVTSLVFRALKKVAAKTSTTLDDKLFPALEAPAATFILLVGIFAAFSVLKLTESSDRYLGVASTVAFSLAIFWGLFRALGALLDHAHEIAQARQLGITAFMPWIKRTLVTLFVVVGVLLTAQSAGLEVKAFLAGLGIGGLAFALAAQDTLANVFGSIVVAIDQPFKLGEFVQIGPHSGAVEDIGLRSTKLRRADKSLIIIPNKTVASEAVTNLARFTRRRVEQVIGLTYGTSPEKMEEIVAEIQRIVASQPEVDGAGVMVFFRDFSASSLDVWMAYEVTDPDFKKHMAVKQRINLLIMRAVEARGLSFAFPTQTIELAGPVAEKLASAEGRDGRPARPV